MSLSITPTSLLNTSRVADSVIQCSKSQDDPSKYSVQEVLFCFALVLWAKKFLDQIEAWGVKRYSLFLFVQSCQVWWQSSSLNRIKTQKKKMFYIFVAVSDFLLQIYSFLRCSGILCLKDDGGTKCFTSLMFLTNFKLEGLVHAEADWCLQD